MTNPRISACDVVPAGADDRVSVQCPIVTSLSVATSTARSISSAGSSMARTVSIGVPG